MENPRFIDRREFTLEAVLAALSGVTITITACGGGGGGDSSPSSPSTPPPAATTPPEDKVGSISDNHGHSAVITGAQLTAGNAVQLDIRGSADHTHTVTLNADAIQNIKAGRPVATESTSTEAHLHTVTFNAGASGDPIRY